jgi:hypothetical protein
VRFASTLNDHQGFLAWVRIPHDAPSYAVFVWSNIPGHG